MQSWYNRTMGYHEISTGVNDRPSEVLLGPPRDTYAEWFSALEQRKAGQPIHIIFNNTSVDAQEKQAAMTALLLPFARMQEIPVTITLPVESTSGESSPALQNLVTYIAMIGKPDIKHASTQSSWQCLPKDSYVAWQLQRNTDWLGIDSVHDPHAYTVLGRSLDIALRLHRPAVVELPKAMVHEPDTDLARMLHTIQSEAIVSSAKRGQDVLLFSRDPLDAQKKRQLLTNASGERRQYWEAYCRFTAQLTPEKVAPLRQLVPDMIETINSLDLAAAIVRERGQLVADYFWQELTNVWQQQFPDGNPDILRRLDEHLRGVEATVRLLSEHIMKVTDRGDHSASFLTPEQGELLATAARVHDMLKLLGSPTSQALDDHEKLLGYVARTFLPHFGYSAEQSEFIAAVVEDHENIFKEEGRQHFASSHLPHERAKSLIFLADTLTGALTTTPSGELTLIPDVLERRLTDLYFRHLDKKAGKIFRPQWGAFAVGDLLTTLHALDQRGIHMDQSVYDQIVSATYAGLHRAVLCEGIRSQTSMEPDVADKFTENERETLREAYSAIRNTVRAFSDQTGLSILAKPEHELSTMHLPSTLLDSQRELQAAASQVFIDPLQTKAMTTAVVVDVMRSLGSDYTDAERTQVEQLLTRACEATQRALVNAPDEAAFAAAVSGATDIAREFMAHYFYPRGIDVTAWVNSNVTFNDVVSYVQSQLALSSVPVQVHSAPTETILNTLHRVVPTDDYFRSVLEQQRTFMETGTGMERLPIQRGDRTVLSAKEQQYLDLVIRFASSTWRVSQPHRARHDGKTDRIDPEKRYFVFNPLNIMMLKQYEQHVRTMQSSEDAVYRVAWELWKDVESYRSASEQQSQDAVQTYQSVVAQISHEQYVYNKQFRQSAWRERSHNIQIPSRKYFRAHGSDQGPAFAAADACVASMVATLNRKPRAAEKRLPPLVTSPFTLLSESQQEKVARSVLFVARTMLQSNGPYKTIPDAMRELYYSLPLMAVPKRGEVRVPFPQLSAEYTTAYATVLLRGMQHLRQYFAS